MRTLQISELYCCPWGCFEHMTFRAKYFAAGGYYTHEDASKHGLAILLFKLFCTHRGGEDKT